MFAVEVWYLTGRCVATTADDRRAAEWPPHPARLFAALVSVHYEDVGDADERAALVWLETQGAPEISASDASRRDVCTHYVPVNDATVPRANSDAAARAAVAVLPDRRGRQPRAFPSVTPHNDHVWFIWRDADPPRSVRETLSALVQRLTALGHSSSLVAVRVVPSPPTPTWVPHERGGRRFRVPGPGQLDALDTAHDVARTHGVRGPLPCDTAAYATADEATRFDRRLRRTPFGEWVVLVQTAGAGPDLTTFAALTGALRETVLSIAGDGCPEVLSGHAPGGAPSAQPHVAYIPLPFVGAEHADGRLLGVAALLPDSITSGDRRLAFRTLACISEIRMGRGGVWRVAPVTGLDTRSALNRDRWFGPSLRWRTVTPVILDRHPRELVSDETAAIVATSCERLGLPRPEAVVVSAASPVRGVPSARNFHAIGKNGRPRLRVHAEIIFPEQVQGPLVVGAGRFLGFGLCLPVRE